MEELDYPVNKAGAHALGDVIATASITAAVTPFVQQLAKKAADDTYEAARGWLRRLFRQAPAKQGSSDPDSQVLIVRDPALDLWLILPITLSDQAIDTLSQLDLEQVVADARRAEAVRSRIYLDQRSGLWRVEH